MHHYEFLIPHISKSPLFSFSPKSHFLPLSLSTSFSLTHKHKHKHKHKRTLMLNPANDLAPPPSSPTNSSPSSSDLDTESTGSFFHDRSTTLGNLMGVTLQAITFRATSQHRQQENHPTAAVNGGRRNKNPKKSRAAAARQRRRWWRLCRDECDSRRASLGEYLEVERRFADGGGGGPAAELEEGLVQEVPRNGRALFADGRVLPPEEVVEESSPVVGAGMCRFTAVERWCNLV